MFVDKVMELNEDSPFLKATHRLRTKIADKLKHLLKKYGMKFLQKTELPDDLKKYLHKDDDDEPPCNQEAAHY